LIQEHFDHDPELVRYLQDKRSDGLLAELAYLESGLHLTYIRQSGPQGVADALSLAEDWVGGSAFVTALGDSIVCESETGTLLRTMIAEHQEGGAAATIAVELNTRDRLRHHSLVLPLDGKDVAGGVFDVAEIVDKPRSAETTHEWTIAARYVFGPAIFEAIRCTRPARSGELQLVEALRMLLRQGERVRAVCLKPGQRHHDIGDFGGYFRACIEFALADEDLGTEMREYIQECLKRTSECGEDS
jgi:UTP--glucose-1-phosphate uridylyltransferase